jgi:hypothetical protein
VSGNNKEMTLNAEKFSMSDIDGLRSLNTLLTGLLIEMVKTMNSISGRPPLSTVDFRMCKNILDYDISLIPVLDKENTELGIRVTLIETKNLKGH